MATDAKTLTNNVIQAVADLEAQLAEAGLGSDVAPLLEIRPATDQQSTAVAQAAKQLSGLDLAGSNFGSAALIVAAGHRWAGDAGAADALLTEAAGACVDPTLRARLAVHSFQQNLSKGQGQQAVAAWETALAVGGEVAVWHDPVGYPVDLLLGAGSLGYSLLCVDGDDDVVVKSLWLPRWETGDSVFAAAEALLGLEHEALITPLDYGWSSGRVRQHPFIATAYRPDALNAFAWLAAEGSLSWTQAKTMGQKLLAGLQAMDERGFAHGALHPGNLLMESGDKAPLARWTDLGVAQAAQLVLPAAGATVNGESSLLARRLSGLGAFLAPERLDGAAPAASADVYGFAATLSFLVTGSAGLGQLEAKNAPKPWIELLAACRSDDPAKRPTLAELSDRWAALKAKNKRLDVKVGQDAWLVALGAEAEDWSAREETATAGAGEVAEAAVSGDLAVAAEAAVTAVAQEAADGLELGALRDAVARVTTEVSKQATESTMALAPIKVADAEESIHRAARDAALLAGRPVARAAALQGALLAATESAAETLAQASKKFAAQRAEQAALAAALSGAPDAAVQTAARAAVAQALFEAAAAAPPKLREAARAPVQAAGVRAAEVAVLEAALAPAEEAALAAVSRRVAAQGESWDAQAAWQEAKAAAAAEAAEQAASEQAAVDQASKAAEEAETEAGKAADWCTQCTEATAVVKAALADAEAAAAAAEEAADVDAAQLASSDAAAAAEAAKKAAAESERAASEAYMAERAVDGVVQAAGDGEDAPQGDFAQQISAAATGAAQSEAAAKASLQEAREHLEAAQQAEERAAKALDELRQAATQKAESDAASAASEAAAEAARNRAKAARDQTREAAAKAGEKQETAANAVGAAEDAALEAADAETLAAAEAALEQTEAKVDAVEAAVTEAEQAIDAARQAHEAAGVAAREAAEAAEEDEAATQVAMRAAQASGQSLEAVNEAKGLEEKLAALREAASEALQTAQDAVTELREAEEDAGEGDDAEGEAKEKQTELDVSATDEDKADEDKADEDEDEADEEDEEAKAAEAEAEAAEKEAKAAEAEAEAAEKEAKAAEKEADTAEPEPAAKDKDKDKDESKSKSKSKDRSKGAKRSTDDDKKPTRASKPSEAKEEGGGGGKWIIGIVLLLVVGAIAFFAIKGKGGKSDKKKSGTKPPVMAAAMVRPMPPPSMVDPLAAERKTFGALVSWYGKAQQAVRKLLTGPCQPAHKAGYRYHTHLVPTAKSEKIGNMAFKVHTYALAVKPDPAGKAQGALNLFACLGKLAGLHHDHAMTIKIKAFKLPKFWITNWEFSGKLLGYLKPLKVNTAAFFNWGRLQPVKLKQHKDPGVRALGDFVKVKAGPKTLQLSNLTFKRVVPGFGLGGQWQVSLRSGQFAKQLKELGSACSRQLSPAFKGPAGASSDGQKRVLKAAQGWQRRFCGALGKLTAALAPGKAAQAKQAGAALIKLKADWQRSVRAPLVSEAKRIKVPAPRVSPL